VCSALQLISDIRAIIECNGDAACAKWQAHLHLEESNLQAQLLRLDFIVHEF
jgi:hypothetical protein